MYGNMPYSTFNGAYGGFNGNIANYTPNVQNGFYGQSAGLIRVNGIDGAKAFQLKPRETVPLFDANDDIMYIKSADDGGFPSLRAFRFSEIDLTGTKSTPEYVTKDEFDKLKQEVEQYGKQFIPAKPAKGKSVSDDGAI